MVQIYHAFVTIFLERKFNFWSQEFLVQISRVFNQHFEAKYLWSKLISNVFPSKFSDPNILGLYHSTYFYQLLESKYKMAQIYQAFVTFLLAANMFGPK